MRHLKQLADGRWQLRYQPPKEVRDLIGKREFKKSLGHCSPKEAEEKAHPILNQWKQTVSKALSTLNNNWEEANLAAIESSGDDAESRQQAHIQANQEYAATTGTSAEHEAGYEAMYIAKAAQAFTRKANGLSVNTDIPEDLIETFIDNGAAYGYLVKTEQHLTSYEKIELSELKGRSKDLTIGAIKQQFAKTFPIIHPDTINSAKVQSWINSYYMLDKPPLRETMNRYLRSPRAYFSWLIRQGLTSLPNPFNDVALPRQSKKKQSAPRKAFTDSELSLLYKVMLKKKKRDYTLEHLFLIAAYTGCRIEEICQLRKEDVHQITKDNGIRFYIKLSESKTDKGVNREIPVHPKIHFLIRSLARDTENGYLIEEGSKTSYGERSSKLGKRFGRLKTSLGFGPELVFHSLRRTFISQLETNCIDERITADIVGHEISTMTYGVYGSGTPINQRFEAIDPISFPNLEKQLNEPTTHTTSTKKP